MRKTSLSVAWLILLLVGFDAQAFYNPSTGRWISRDPIGEQGGINIYAYTANRPLQTIDMLGQCIIDVMFAPLEQVKWITAYHAYILVTDRDGYRFFFRGGPSLPGPGDYGAVRVDHDDYVAGMVDYDDKGEHRRMRIYEDCDSCDRWYHALNLSGEAINTARIPYDPLTTNCNWAVANMLKDAGLWNVSFRDLTVPPYFAPGWNHPWPERPEPND